MVVVWPKVHFFGCTVSVAKFRVFKNGCSIDGGKSLIVHGYGLTETAPFFDAASAARSSTFLKTGAASAAANLWLLMVTWLRFGRSCIFFGCSVGVAKLHLFKNGCSIGGGKSLIVHGYGLTEAASFFDAASAARSSTFLKTGAASAAANFWMLMVTWLRFGRSCIFFGCSVGGAKLDLFKNGCSIGGGKTLNVDGHMVMVWPKLHLFWMLMFTWLRFDRSCIFFGCSVGGAKLHVFKNGCSIGGGKSLIVDGYGLTEAASFFDAAAAARSSTFLKTGAASAAANLWMLMVTWLRFGRSCIFFGCSVGGAKLDLFKNG